MTVRNVSHLQTSSGVRTYRPGLVKALPFAFAIFMSVVVSGQAVHASCLPNLNCTAKNVNMGNIVVRPQASDPTCTGPADTIDVKFVIDINGTPQVYDMAIMVSLDGSGVIGGSNCAIENKALPHGNAPIEGQCFDKAKNNQTWITDTYTISCTDSDGDGDLDVDVGFSRYSNAGDQDDTASCNVNALVAQTSSQCSAEENFNTGITVPPASSGKSADIGIIKTFVEGSTFTPGSTGTYQLAITNGGPDVAVGILVQDLLPTGVTLSGSWTCTSGTGVTCPASGGTVGGTSISATVDLEVGKQALISVPVLFSANASGY